MRTLTDVPTACGVETCDTAELEVRSFHGATTELGEPIPTIDTVTVELLAPVGVQQVTAAIDEADRNKTVERWRFWLVPSAPVDTPTRIRFGGDAFDVKHIDPKLVRCCGRLKLHHIEVEADRVAG